MVLMATWEAQFTASSFALLNGGTAGAIYVYIGAFAGFFLAICSMAEIASMAPTTGGQYRESFPANQWHRRDGRRKLTQFLLRLGLRI